MVWGKFVVCEALGIYCDFEGPVSADDGVELALCNQVMIGTMCISKLDAQQHAKPTSR
jgi:hypothetical protein